MKGVSPRKDMAMGDGGDFGVESPPAHIPGEVMKHKPMRDDDRAAPGPVKHTRGKLPSQAEPDHGPHGIPRGAASDDDMED